MKNYFNHQEAAKRYKIGRPDFHSLVVDKIKKKLGLEEKLQTCLDVACGTGLLSEALLEISEKVIGIDNSTGMLSQVKENPRIEYILGQAEKLEIVKELVDLITVSSAFHWFDQAAFLESSYNRLGEGKYIVVHNNYFTSTTNDEGSKSFKKWMKESYLKKFVSPKRNLKPVDEAGIKSIGFEISESEKFENEVTFTKLNLVDYLVTQSNVISNVELGNYTIDEIRDWLGKELSVHFKEGEERTFIFGNRMFFLKKK